MSPRDASRERGRAPSRALSSLRVARRAARAKKKGARARLQLAPEDVARAAPLGLEERGDERPDALLDALEDAQVLLGEGLLAPVVPERGSLLV